LYENRTMKPVENFLSSGRRMRENKGEDKSIQDTL
jgi:hypothetical protein